MVYFRKNKYITKPLRSVGEQLVDITKLLEYKLEKNYINIYRNEKF